ncbi:MAG: O-antigen ligase family protein [Lachnospiraceae bacterium]|nr:O-antigen ligase family protein [Lachnospiraceae bacterium]
MKQKGNVQSKKEMSKLLWLPILLVLAVIPLVTIIHMYETDLAESNWFSWNSQVFDFFLYYKSRLLMLIGLAGACLLGYFLATGNYGNFTGKKAYLPLIPAGVFALFSLFSALLSEHAEDAFWGGYEQFEGVFVLLTYVICFSLVYGYACSEKTVELLLEALIIGALIVSLLGAFQAAGLDWIKSGWARGFLSTEIKGAGDFNINLSFPDGTAYATLYNPNYVGSYVAVVLPVTVMLTIWNRKLPFRIMAGIASVCQLIMMYASQSSAGYVGLAGAVMVLLVFALPAMKRNGKRTLIGAGICVVAIAAVFIAKPGIIQKILLDDTIQSNYMIRSIVTKDDSFTITTESGKTIVGKYDTGDSIYSFSLANEKGEPLAFDGDSFSGVTVTEEGYEKIQFLGANVSLKESSETLPALQIKAGDKSWNLVQQNNKLRYYNLYGKLDKLQKIDSFGFEGNYDFATKRGYIWSRTFPLLPKTIFLGTGADNFTYTFPNNDYVGKINTAFDGQTMTKPHNMYLQIWVQDGMLACLALIALFILLAVDTLKTTFLCREKTWLHRVSIAILCGAAGYMVVGLANDSTICVAPVFWTLMGLGFAVNRLIGKKTADAS